MPFTRPTLPELITRIGADIDSRLAGSDSRLRRSNTRVLAIADAGVAHGLHGHLAWIARQKFATTADDEALVAEGQEYGLAKKPADFARGTLTAAGINGSVIADGTLWQRADGREYRVDADATIAAGTAAVSVVALEAGADGNTDAGVTLTLVNSLEGVEPAAPVAAPGLLMGADIEGTEAFRTRLLERKRKKPAGGNKYDYVAWAKAITGVADAWPVPRGQGPGTVDLLILADPEITGDVIPTAELCATVRAAIVDICPNDVKYLRVLPPTPRPLDFSLSVTPDTAAVRVQVAAEFADLVARSAEPAPRLAEPTVTIPLSQINEAISLAAGETDHAVTAPAADVAITAYELPVMGVITWL